MAIRFPFLASACWCLPKHYKTFRMFLHPLRVSTKLIMKYRFSIFHYEFKDDWICTNKKQQTFWKNLFYSLSLSWLCRKEEKHIFCCFCILDNSAFTGWLIKQCLLNTFRCFSISDFVSSSSFCKSTYRRNFTMKECSNPWNRHMLHKHAFYNVFICK